jgi:hypothetical protein
MGTGSVGGACEAGRSSVSLAIGGRSVAEIEFSTNDASGRATREGASRTGSAAGVAATGSVGGGVSAAALSAGTGSIVDRSVRREMTI